ncbi:BphX family protein [Sphingobium olei]|uniref:BphX family protein n=1 Tax=Sphingobium olei TaxID=420955 RepID=A0ABW3P0F2_9SPHN
MQGLRIFFIASGIWYLCNLILLWPPVYAGALPLIYPGIDLGQGKPVFDLLLDAWLIVGIQLAAIGVVALWGARQPWKYIALVPVIVLTEAVGAAWDIYSLLCSGEAEWVVFTTLAAHAVIVLGAWYTWTAAHREKAQQGAVTS